MKNQITYSHLGNLIMKEFDFINQLKPVVKFVQFSVGSPVSVQVTNKDKSPAISGTFFIYFKTLYL